MSTKHQSSVASLLLVGSVLLYGHQSHLPLAVWKGHMFRETLTFSTGTHWCANCFKLLHMSKISFTFSDGAPIKPLIPVKFTCLYLPSPLPVDLISPAPEAVIFFSCWCLDPLLAGRVWDPWLRRCYLLLRELCVQSQHSMAGWARGTTCCHLS